MYRIITTSPMVNPKIDQLYITTFKYQYTAYCFALMLRFKGHDTIVDYIEDELEAFRFTKGRDENEK